MINRPGNYISDPQCPNTKIPTLKYALVLKGENKATKKDYEGGVVRGARVVAEGEKGLRHFKIQDL